MGYGINYKCRIICTLFGYVMEDMDMKLFCSTALASIAKSAVASYFLYFEINFQLWPLHCWSVFCLDCGARGT